MTKRMAKASLAQPSLLRTPREHREALPKIEQQILSVGLQLVAGFVPEYPFAVTVGRKWRFDYAWTEHRVALEREGGGGYVVTDHAEQKHWVSRSRHATLQGMTDDCEKYNSAAIAGWLVIRFTPPMERTGAALNHLLNALKARGWRKPCCDEKK